MVQRHMNQLMGDYETVMDGFVDNGGSLFRRPDKPLSWSLVNERKADVRQIVFYCSPLPDRVDEFRQYNQWLKRMGWSMAMVHPTDKCPEYEEQDEAQAIIIDHKLLSEVPNCVSIRDMIVHLRVFGFDKLIGLLFDDEDAARHFMKSNNRDIAEVAIVCFRPLNQAMIIEIGNHYAVTVFSKLLQTEGYCVQFDKRRSQVETLTNQFEKFESFETLRTKAW